MSLTHVYELCIGFFYSVNFLSFSLHLRTKAACFPNVVQYIIFAVTMKRFHNHASDVSHFIPLSKNCMVQYNSIRTHTVCRNVSYL
jgi:hypothetical protein